ncbi:hypothetical protein CCACVL1_23795 [Corchorus capsularis]|uniref:Uncharacterized protein n=1 Tax=Corchorus capsularis TaxID=210143 RepID=A0A1R3GSH6_COCAP|nr:hypothetical protein CCACVL1_23795 [Corchorus capsularis]
MALMERHTEDEQHQCHFELKELRAVIEPDSADDDERFEIDKDENSPKQSDERTEGNKMHGIGWPKKDLNLGAGVINFGADEIGENESPPKEDEDEWCPELFPTTPLLIAAPPMVSSLTILVPLDVRCQELDVDSWHPQSKEDGDPPKLNSDNHHLGVMDGFDITRISSIDPFLVNEREGAIIQHVVV